VEWSRTIGGLKLLRVENSSADELIVLVEATDSEQVMKGTIRTGGKYLFIGFDLAERPAELAIPRLSEDQAWTAMTSRADEFAARNKISGVFLIARDGVVIHKRAWGMSDRQAHVPVSFDTKFRIASLGKMFTATAVLQLVAQGKLTLDGKVGNYLPDYPNRDIATKVSVRELLDHTGGTGEVFTPEYMAHRNEIRTLKDYVTFFGARGPDFEPGSKDDYSNYGYILLGRIVEAVSGSDWYDYVRARVYQPAGMRDTGDLPESVSVPGRATGYTFNGGKWGTDADLLPWRGTPAGGGYSTAADMLRFAEALHDGKLIPPALLNEATAPQNNGHWYGYGFETHGKGVTRYFSHSGGAYGSNAEFRVYPELGVVAIALCNTDPNACADLIERYTTRMPLGR
jgi:CubicO group peptidase (beta-lactamase class C family)